MSEDRKPIFSVRKKDLRIDTFSAGGPGGQNQNKKQSGVRITHLESGLSAESRVHRDQRQNKLEAFRKLAKKVVAWFLRRETLKTIRARTDEIVRTYHEPDNRVVDKSHEQRVGYSEMLNDPAATEQMVDARRDAQRLSGDTDEDE